MVYNGNPKIVGFPPKSSILIEFSIINHPFWGTPIFGNIHLPSQERSICRLEGWYCVVFLVLGVMLSVLARKTCTYIEFACLETDVRWNPLYLHNIPGKCLGITFFRISKFRSQLIEEQFFASLEPCWEI